nr:hypothetical protein [Tanacetum cinerariifolium]
MDDPNITMEEYIMSSGMSSGRRGKVYNWETAKYRKIWYDEDVYDLRSVKTEFLAIIFNDNLTSDNTLSCEPRKIAQCNGIFIARVFCYFHNYVLCPKEEKFKGKISRTDDDSEDVIKESLVKMKQKGVILELKRRHLKNIIFFYYAPYPAMKIRRINASLAQETRNDRFPIWRITLYQYAVCIAVHQSKIRI